MTLDEVAADSDNIASTAPQSAHMLGQRTEKGYEPGTIHADLAERKIEPVIPGRSNRGLKIEYGRGSTSSGAASSASSATSKSIEPLPPAKINWPTALSEWSIFP